MATQQAKQSAMRFEVHHKPVFYILIRDFFTREQHKAIIDEAMRNEPMFEDAVTGKGLDKKFRSNLVCYYDTFYFNNRDKSQFLSALDSKFKDSKFGEILSSSPYPVTEFGGTNYHEAQISRYGGVLQKYDWHIDRFNNTTRTLSLVYYFFKEPKMFHNGELQLTDSPIADGFTIEDTPNIVTIKPENNMAVVFGSFTAHRVLPTKSPNEWSDGRFSGNVWIGFK